jgi:ankyrin repeat protein
MAIQKNDVESVLFLLSIHVDVNSRVQDATQTPPLHLAAASGSEMLVRSLLLAGARVSQINLYLLLVIGHFINICTCLPYMTMPTHLCSLGLAGSTLAL